MGVCKAVLAGNRGDRIPWRGELDPAPLALNNPKAPTLRSEEISVERKTEIQYRPEQTVRLNILGDSPETLTAQMVTLSGRRASLKVQGTSRPGRLYEST